MTTAIRLVTLTLILSLMAGGPLAPALAQQPVQPSEPAQSSQPPQSSQPAQPSESVQPSPPAPPAPTVQRDLFQERMKIQRRDAAAYNTGAGVVNAFLVPGRAITCVLGTAVGIAVLALTFGSGYEFAAAVGHEGCGGKWIVTGEDLWPDPPVRPSSDWDQRQ